jgi:hypothetical protein
MTRFAEDFNGLIQARVFRTLESARKRIEDYADAMESLRDNFSASLRRPTRRYRL